MVFRYPIGKNLWFPEKQGPAFSSNPVTPVAFLYHPQKRENRALSEMVVLNL
jgi:hypothetical protein